MIENRFVTAGSSFIDLAAWDRCVRPELGAVPSNPSLPVWVGVDASVRRDSSAIVAVTYKDDVVRLVFHRIFTPSPNDPINFAESIEGTLLDLQKRFGVRKVLFDPYQMVSTAQRLAKAGVKVEEFPQTVPNLTAASQQLFELIHRFIHLGLRVAKQPELQSIAHELVDIDPPIRLAPHAAHAGVQQYLGL
jgi:phage terminase large subunit-like protein